MLVIVTIAGKLTLATKHVISNRMPGKSFNEHSIRYRKLPVPDVYFPQLSRAHHSPQPLERPSLQRCGHLSGDKSPGRRQLPTKKKTAIVVVFRDASKIHKSENQDHQRMNAKKKDSEH